MRELSSFLKVVILKSFRFAFFTGTPEGLPQNRSQALYAMFAISFAAIILTQFHAYGRIGIGSAIGVLAALAIQYFVFSAFIPIIYVAAYAAVLIGTYSVAFFAFFVPIASAYPSEALSVLNLWIVAATVVAAFKIQAYLKKS